jgi:hypothetical protein
VAHPWAEAYWNEARAAATYGGGLALDAPPAFYFRLPDETQRRAYQQFTQDAIAWATDKGLWVNFLVSPYFDYPNFLANAQKEYASLLTAKTLPSNWTILNYEVCRGAFPNPCIRGKSPPFGAPVGDEDTPNTVASVTPWFAQHARVRKYSGKYSAFSPRTDDSGYHVDKARTFTIERSQNRERRVVSWFFVRSVSLVLYNI